MLELYSLFLLDRVDGWKEWTSSKILAAIISFVFFLLSVLLHHDALLYLNYIFFSSKHNYVPLYRLDVQLRSFGTQQFCMGCWLRQRWLALHQRSLSPPMLGPYKPRPNLKVSQRIIWRTRSIRYQHDRGLHASRQDERESWCNEQWGIRSLLAHRRLKAKNRATGNMSVLPFSFLPPLCAMNSRFFPLHAN